MLNRNSLLLCSSSEKPFSEQIYHITVAFAEHKDDSGYGYGLGYITGQVGSVSPGYLYLPYSSADINRFQGCNDLTGDHSLWITAKDSTSANADMIKRVVCERLDNGFKVETSNISFSRHILGIGSGVEILSDGDDQALFSANDVGKVVQVKLSIYVSE